MLNALSPLVGPAEADTTKEAQLDNAIAC
jgi:hypothetical protein